MHSSGADRCLRLDVSGLDVSGLDVSAISPTKQGYLMDMVSLTDKRK